MPSAASRSAAACRRSDTGGTARTFRPARRGGGRARRATTVFEMRTPSSTRSGRRSASACASASRANMSRAALTSRFRTKCAAIAIVPEIDRIWVSADGSDRNVTGPFVRRPITPVIVSPSARAANVSAMRCFSTGSASCDDVVDRRRETPLDQRFRADRQHQRLARHAGPVPSRSGGRFQRRRPCPDAPSAPASGSHRRPCPAPATGAPAAASPSVLRP